MARKITSMTRPAPAAAPARPAGKPPETVPAGTWMAGPPRTDLPPGPAPAGTVFLPGNASLTEGETQTLTRLGWKPGDPIPADLATAIEAAKQDAGGLHPDINPQTFKGPQPPRQVNIEELPPEKLAELRNFMRQGRTYYQQQQQQTVAVDLPQPLPGASDSVNRGRVEAYRILQQQEAQKQEVQSAGSAPVPEPAAPEVAQELKETLGSLKRCPRCDHDLAAPLKVEPTTQDKRDFLIALLGGQRFRKEYALLGGRLRFRFRTLTVRESDMIFRQFAADNWHDTQLQEGNVQAREMADTYWRNILSYRMVLSLEAVTTDQLGPKEICTLEEFQIPREHLPPPPHTPLRVFYAEILEQALSSEHLRQLAGRVFLQFDELVTTLAARADDADFYTATE